MTKSQDLSTPAPSEQAIVRQYKSLIARSPTDIKPGEVILLDRRGVAVSRARFSRLVLLLRTGIYGALIGGAVLMFSGASTVGGLLYLAGAIPLVRGWYRGGTKLMAIEVLIRRGNLEEAQRRFDAVPELRRRDRAAYCSVAGNLASHRGDYATALTWWREAFPQSKGLQRNSLRLSIVRALLLSGDAKNARRMFDEAQLPSEADEVIMSVTLTRVMFALLDAASAPPADEELHDWARQILAYSHTGVELAALGWLFERRGDEDMARFLAMEAPERMHYRYLATWWPALQAWLDGHTTK